MDNEREQIAKMYEKGMSMRSIAKKLNKHHSSVANTVRSLINSGECADRDVVDWQNKMYVQGCGVIPGRQVGEMPYVEKKKLEDYPLVVVRGKTYRDVTDSLYYSTRYKSIYLSDKEKEKRKEREKEDEIRLREKMREREQEEAFVKKSKGQTLSKKQLSEDDICNDLNAGHPKSHIQQRYGITNIKLNSIINKLNFEGRYGPENLVTNKEEMELVRKYLEEGLNRGEIASKIGKSNTKVKLICDRLIMMGEPIDAYKHRRKDSLTKKERTQIIKLRKQGRSYEKISHEVNRSYFSVWKVLSQAIEEGELVE